MTKLRILGAAALLAAVIATPAMAQQAMQEPGAYRQAHPWANDYHYRYGGLRLLARSRSPRASSAARSAPQTRLLRRRTAIPMPITAAPRL